MDQQLQSFVSGKYDNSSAGPPVLKARKIEAQMGGSMSLPVRVFRLEASVSRRHIILLTTRLSTEESHHSSTVADKVSMYRD
jgi:hypothetical protein